MLFFMSVAVFYFYDNMLFLVFLSMLLFTFFNMYSWTGSFLVVDSLVYIMLIFMMLLILALVHMSENNMYLKILSNFLVLFCLFFFISSNFLMLYIFFELSMLPMMFMILGWGQQIEKVSSIYYLVFYTFFCSLPFLYIYFKLFKDFNYCYMDFFLSWECFFIMSLGFMMKFPVYFLHLWLPKAHVEAPTTASMLLAGLLLKLGTGGFLRLMSSFNYLLLNFWVYLSMLGMIVASLSCAFQSDSKSLAAFSSISHMSFLLLSLCYLMMGSKSSSLILMLAHGFTSTLMFYLIGEYYHLIGTRMIYFFNGGLGSNMFMVFLFIGVFLSNAGVPPSLSFISEFMTISLSWLYSKMIMFMMIIYFSLVFYYNMFFLVNYMMSKNYINVFSFNMSNSLFLVLMMYNFFLLSVLS